MVRLPRNEKQTYRLNSKSSNVTIRLDLGHDLDLQFSRSNMELPIFRPKVVRLPRNEKQTYRLNPRLQMWPMGLTFEFWRSNVTLTFDHTPDLDHEFSWSNFEIAVSQNGKDITKGVGVGHSWPWPFGAKVRCMDLPDSDRGDLSCWRAVDSSSSICFSARFAFVLAQIHWSQLLSWEWRCSWSSANRHQFYCLLRCDLY